MQGLTVTITVDFSFVPGWGLIALPVIQTPAMTAQALAGINGRAAIAAEIDH
ncbi:MAG: hypothetical protein M9927_07825 [Anaerolineae bacterium]|nr:hypothetical protein [Anaerolineae bacterium]